MLFNSYEFLFLFFPIVLLGYFALGKREDSNAANLWLVAASLFFYSYWNVRYLPLLLASIAFNYVCSGVILRDRKRADKRMVRKAVFIFGLCVNVGLLGFYKYTDFFLENVNFIAGTDFNLLHIILPLGISFFTITQMVYLVDCYEGVAKDHNLVNYTLFVSFFPHLLAGPILYHKSMMKQFANPETKTVQWENIARGFTLFIIGLAKKVLLADTFMTYVSPGFNDPAGLTFVDAWITALSYMFQLYFDFSGYSDMAVGIARMMNIEIPINFNSPYRAYGIIDFWRRWHMSLGTCVRNYIYIPLGGNRLGEKRKMENLFLSMLILGLWHGAGWNYIIFGAIHGFALIVNHTWKRYRLRMWRPLGYTLTLGTVLVGWIFFRADSIHDAWLIMMAMCDPSQIILPAGGIVEKYFVFLKDSGVIFSGDAMFMGLKYILVGSLCVAFLPSSNRIVERMKPTIVWAFVVAAVGFVSMIRMGSYSEFLYFQF